MGISGEGLVLTQISEETAWFHSVVICYRTFTARCWAQGWGNLPFRQAEPWQLGVWSYMPAQTGWTGLACLAHPVENGCWEGSGIMVKDILEKPVENLKVVHCIFLNVGDVIVTTPHSLLRLLTYRSLLFLRLCHLVLDEVHMLFFEANEQVSMGTWVSAAVRYNSGNVSEVWQLFTD